MQFIHIRYIKHEDNEKNEKVRVFSSECLPFVLSPRILLSHLCVYFLNRLVRLQTSGSVVAAVSRRITVCDCDAFSRAQVSRAARFTSPEVAALARADTRRRYSDRACHRSWEAGFHPRDRPSVSPICPHCEHSGRATEKYSSDLCSRCNPRFRHRPACLRPRCWEFSTFQYLIFFFTQKGLFVFFFFLNF